MAQVGFINIPAYGDKNFFIPTSRPKARNMLYPSYRPMHTFLLECDICHGQISVQNERELIKCPVCGKKLCTNCNHYGFCEADFAQISVEDQEKLKQISQKYDQAKEANTKQVKKSMLLLLACVALCAVLLFGSLNWMFVYGPEFVVVGFLSPVPLIAGGLYLYRTSKGYPVLDEQRKVEQIAVASRYISKS